MATLDEILERIELKKADYVLYDFSRTENDALKTFFDLSQEYDSTEDLNILCVAIPRSFFRLHASLYLVEAELNGLGLAAATEEGAALGGPPPEEVRPADRPYYTSRPSLVLTIRGKSGLIDQLPFETSGSVLGLLEIYPVRGLGEHRELFFQKYANRIGFNIHNRFLDEKNIEHLRFIRSLVADIEHNIIVPNMVYKLFLKNLRVKVMKNRELENLLSDYADSHDSDTALERMLKELSEVNSGLISELENIEKHYKNMSLFIETLFRKSHFDQGRLTLRTKPCNMKKDVVRPQIERYLDQFRRAGISIDDRSSSIPEEDIISVVDIGLMAQVYANLFSNALKYTQEVTLFGERKKFIAYGYQIMRDYFGAGRDGVKYNVFSSGPHIPPSEREAIFEEGYRGSDASDRPGTGHGLAFIKNVIEIHGGSVGYEPTNYGNNFYFILPR